MREKKEWERVGEDEKTINNPWKRGSWGLGLSL